MAEDQNSEQSGTDDWGDALAEQQTAGTPQAAEFDSLQQTDNNPGQGGQENLDTILDIPVTLSIELGRTQMSIDNLLKLNQGSVVELERLAGEPLDVLVNGCMVAHAEVVVVNDRFGVRMTDILSPKERVKTLA